MFLCGIFFVVRKKLTTQINLVQIFLCRMAECDKIYVPQVVTRLGGHIFMHIGKIKG